eukprot:5349949-Amphidinium_carterae.1
MSFFFARMALSLELVLILIFFVKLFLLVASCSRGKSVASLLDVLGVEWFHLSMRRFSSAPQSDVTKMAEDLRLVLSYELARGSSLTESHLASVRALALQCQQ